MTLLTRLVIVLEALATELRRANDSHQAIFENNAAVLALEQQKLEADRAWRAIEQEHMKVCERRFRALQIGEAMDSVTPVKH